MVIRSELFANLGMYVGQHTINGSAETFLVMNQKTNGSLMKSKRSTGRILIKVTAE